MNYLLHVFLLLLLVTTAQAQQKEHWICPNATSNSKQMMDPGSSWDTLKGCVNVYKMYIGALGSGRDSAYLRKSVQTLRNSNIKFAVEAGGLRPFSGCDTMAGERHAQSELQSMQRWIDAGGTIDYIAMDSPINTMIRNGQSGNCNWSVTQAAGELADYMAAVRAVLPNVKFGWIEPVPWYRVGAYPNHPGNNYGDLIDVIDTVVSIVEENGEHLDFFHADSPYEYSNDSRTDGWNKLAELEFNVKLYDMRFGVIYNSELGGNSNDSIFYARTLDGWRKYDEAWGDPDDLIVQSWYLHPAFTLPETAKYTFTYTAREFFRQAGCGNQGTAPPAKFEPADGLVYHGVGQYPQGVDEYDAAMPDSTRPLLVKLYVDIPGSRGQNYDALRQALAREKAIGRFPELSIGFHDGRGSTDSVIAMTTQHDAIIDSIAKICKEYGSRMFLRPGFEFNGPWNAYHPYLYVTAFRKIINRFDAMGAGDSVAIVWCYYPGNAPNDFDSTDARGPRWYPGDAYVDWFGLDLFNSTDFDPAQPDSVRGAISTKGKSERFLAMARAKGKPVLLSETSAKGVNITADPQDGGADWSIWFAPFWSFIGSHPEIKGFCYINWDWRAYPTWSDWGNARIDSNSYILMKYREEMRKPKYIHLPFDRTPGGGLAAPGLISPANGGGVVGSATTLVWRGPLGATRYRVQLATSADFASPLVDDSSVTGESFPVASLVAGTRYYWRVQATSPTLTSPWSAIWSFTPGIALPGRVLLISPADSAVISTSEVELRWHMASPAVDRYWVEVSGDPGFSRVLIDSTDGDTTMIQKPLSEGVTYWWRVRAHNSAGWGAFSEIRIFTAVDIPSSVAGDPETGSLGISPNPFTSSTVISFQLARREHVTLALFDGLGREVRIVLEDDLAEGEHTVVLEGDDLPSGVYSCRLTGTSLPARAVRVVVVR